jgi:hypothetical protein
LPISDDERAERERRKRRNALRTWWRRFRRDLGRQWPQNHDGDWGSPKGVRDALIEGSKSLQDKYSLRVGASKVEWYGSIVMLLGPHCNVSMYAESGRDRVYVLTLVSKEFISPKYYSQAKWAVSLWPLMQGHGSEDDIRVIKKCSDMPDSRAENLANIAALCDLLAKYGDAYLRGTADTDAATERWQNRTSY